MIKTEYNENNDTTTIYLEYNEENLKKYNVDRLQFMGLEEPEIEIQMNKIQDGGSQTGNTENLTIPYKYFHILMNNVSNKLPTAENATEAVGLGEKIKNSIVNAWNNLDTDYSFRKFNEFMSLGLTERIAEQEQQTKTETSTPPAPTLGPLEIKSMILIKVRGHYEIGATYDSIEPKTIKNIVEYKKTHPIQDDILGVLERNE